MLTRPSFRKFLIVMALAAMAPPALAGLIYHWQPDPQSAPGATGSVEFAPGVTQFDNEDEALAFSFTTPGTDESDGWTYDSSFAFEALRLVEVGGEYLCFVSCTEKKTVKRAAKKGTFIFFSRVDDNDNTLLDWRAGYQLHPENVDERSAFIETGIGRWVRVGDGVRVPEPPVVFLLLAGLGLFALIRRRVVAKTTASSPSR